ncbi:MAG TPA: molybdopterin-dependent oxidoreductase, partial [Burkholderiales bacterium]|nr:molybdopterin-dependent oxidoreductase [Burkholderiales bacterium]
MEEKRRREVGHLASPRSSFEQPSASGKIARRAFLTRSAEMVAATAAAWVAPAGAADAPLWMKTPGKPLSRYGQPSRHEAGVLRALAPNYGALDPGTGTSRTPLHLLEGTITPSGLHFERHHNGVPDIDPAQHKLLIHGLVKKPLEFSIAALLRYPMVSRTCFIECA